MGWEIVDLKQVTKARPNTKIPSHLNAFMPSGTAAPVLDFLADPALNPVNYPENVVEIIHGLGGSFLTTTSLAFLPPQTGPWMRSNRSSSIGGSLEQTSSRSVISNVQSPWLIILGFGTHGRHIRHRNRRQRPSSQQPLEYLRKSVRDMDIEQLAGPGRFDRCPEESSGLLRKPSSVRSEWMGELA